MCSLEILVVGCPVGIVGRRPISIKHFLPICVSEPRLLEDVVVTIVGSATRVAGSWFEYDFGSSEYLLALEVVS